MILLQLFTSTINPAYRSATNLRLDIYFVIFLFLTSSLDVLGSPKPPVQLAKIYDQELHAQDFLISEKYDGIRAIWKNAQLQTRNGNPIHAPEWFVRSLPNTWLDGELWSQRQDFEFIASTVSKTIPDNDQWQQITYMVFDAPDRVHTFQARAERYTQLLNNLSLSHVKPVKQHRVKNNTALSSLLETYVKAGAEGLMLHRADAIFNDGRTDNLLKLKPYMDAEAIVLGHQPGKGKYTGMMGAIEVQLQNKKLHSQPIIFKIGTGFSDQERLNPPQIGDIITFKYHGLSKNNIPKFASFLRIKKPRNASSEINLKNMKFTK